MTNNSPIISDRLRKAVALAYMYRYWHGLPKEIAYHLALQQAPRTDEAMRGNDKLIIELEIDGVKRLYHFLHSGASGYFYHFHDIAADKAVSFLRKNIKKFWLVVQGRIVELTRHFPYVETLVYGGTADDFDRTYKDRQDKR